MNAHKTSPLSVWVDPHALAELTGHRKDVGHPECVSGATELSDGRLLSWGHLGTLRLWASDGTALAELTIRSAFPGVAELRDGRLLSWADEGELRLWASDGVALADLEGHRLMVHGASELSDGRLLSWSDDGTVRLWASNGLALCVLKGHEFFKGRLHNGMLGARELSDGRLLSWGYDGLLRLWGSDGGLLRELTGHDGEIIGAVELTDGRLLSWGAGGMRLWASNGRALGELKVEHGVVGAKVLSDGRLLSWSHWSAQLWASNGTELAQLGKPYRRVNGATELTDGRLLTWGDEGELRLWASDGVALGTLTGHGAKVNGVTELSTGPLLSWSDDATLRLWGSAGEPLATLTGHSDRVGGARELSDGRLLSWSNDSTLRLWTIDGVARRRQKTDRDAVAKDMGLKEGRSTHSTENDIDLSAALLVPSAPGKHPDEASISEPKQLKRSRASRARVPTEAPRIWRGAAEELLNPKEFVERVYGPAIEAGMTQLDLHRLDAKLHMAFHKWCARNNVDPQSVIRSSHTDPDQVVARLGRTPTHAEAMAALRTGTTEGLALWRAYKALVVRKSRARKPPRKSKAPRLG